MTKIFLIRPVRHITPNLAASIEAYRDFRESLGDEVYDPARDTIQDLPGLEICYRNMTAITEADEICIAWDGESQGCLFDLGIAFALHKKIHPVVGLFPRMTNGKSFQNMVYDYEEKVL